MLCAMLAAFAVGVNLGENAATASLLSQEEIETATIQLQGMKEARSRLSTGVFRAHGLESESGSDHGDFSAEVEIFCAFDFVEGMFRFDRSRPTKPSSMAKRQYPDAPDRKQERTTEELRIVKYIEKPEHCILWSNRTPQMVFRKTLEDRPVAFVRPFDVRSLGTILIVDVANFLRLEEICTYLFEQELIEATMEESGLYRLVWEFGPSGSLVRTIWLNPTEGYTPVRLELRSKPGELKQRSEVTWVEIGATWVPDTFMIEQRKPDDTLKRIELAFDWESVNGQISQELFTEAGLDLPPKKTQIISKELGKPVVLGRVGDRAVQPLPESEPTAESRWSMFLAYTAIMLAIVCVVSIGIWRQRAKASGG